MRYFILLVFLASAFDGKTQHAFEKFTYTTAYLADSSIKLTFDEGQINKKKPCEVIIYALPNGNTTAQTFGKKVMPGDDWHFDIQHIGAQTTFIRKTDTLTNYIVVYAENKLKSWPSWRRNQPNSDSIINVLVKDIYAKYKRLRPKITLSGHSGGGSFIFGYINANKTLPSFLKRIGFLDATYGYETDKHQLKLKSWLKNKRNSLQVIAYNDSVVIYNGKPLVSATGGTWYRSKLMAKDLTGAQPTATLDQLIWQHPNANISLILVKNPEAKIFHTVLVERNGFIHLIFNGTVYANKKYQFWDKRAYESFILE